MTTFTIATADRLPGEAGDEGPHPFFDGRADRIAKGAPTGCGFAIGGFPPQWCQQPVQYVGRFRDDYIGEDLGEYDLCAEHAARARTLTGWQRISEMWSVS